MLEGSEGRVQLNYLPRWRLAVASVVLFDADPPLGVLGLELHVHHERQGDASEEGEVKCVEEIGFICGGSGITPAWQVMRAALDDVRDTTRFSVLHTCTRKPVDMLTCVSIYVCM